MRKRILEKLDTEYEFFFLDVMRTSKENIFAISREIEMKKRIKKHLSKLISSMEKDVQGKEFMQLLTTDNLMESCYRYIKDYPQKDIETGCEKYLESVKN